VAAVARRISVLIADDQALVRAGLRAIFESQPEFDVVGEAIDGANAVALAQTRRPDVVLMDVQMPGVDGLEATRRIVALELDTPVAILILTTFDRDEYVHEALRAGASGFLLKDALPEQLVHAVRVVAAGEALIAPAVTKRLIEHFARATPRAAPPAVQELTPRELEVLTLIAQGRSNPEIASSLVLSLETVRTHVKRILHKLRARDRVQAVIVAYDAGLVAPGREPERR
jgi:DNA-binding NarL/FixJ family response regulator